MFNRKLRLFKISYTAHNSIAPYKRETIAIAKDELDVVRQFYKHTIHVCCDITKIEEYEVEKIEQ